MMRWEGKTGLITGASRGLGRAIAKAFALEGAFIGVGYHRFEKGAEQTIAEIQKAGGEAVPVKADITNPEEVDSAIKSFISRQDGIDFLINNAAIVDDQSIALMSAENWFPVIETNLGGAFNCSRAVIRPMIARGGGIIINIGSVAGIAASPGQANYAASKGGLLALTKTMAAELAPKGIRVNAVVPGILAEGIARRLDRRISQALNDRIPLARFGNFNEIVSATLFLASEEASYIIGHSLVVDGGLTL